jgi:glycosyltransferase involved in cell wall biosynthesis
MSREISPKDAVTIWKLYRLLVRLRPQIVHTHTAKAGTVGRIAGLLYRWLTPAALIGRPRQCSFVHTYHGHIFHSYYSKLKTGVFLAVEKFLARVATDRIVVISEQQRREIHEEFGVGRKAQLKVIPLGLDLTPFANWAERREALRNELGVGEQELLIGIVGRLTEIKNHQMFLEAAARLKDEFSQVRFVIIGDGHLRPALEKLAAQLGLKTQIVFLGLRNDPENFYPALDIVVLTSLNEGTPLTLIEAMANARAVAATAVGGVVDLLGEAKAIPDAPSSVMLGERGLLVRGHDPAAFSQALSVLIKNEALRRELGERGQQFVQKNYSKERLVNDIVNLYDDLG